MGKAVKGLLFVFLFFVFLFAGFITGAGTVKYFTSRDEQLQKAWLAAEIIRCTQLIREGQAPDAIQALDSLSSTQLFFSAYDKDRTRMTELPEEILAVWQEAKVYYEKYDVQGYNIGLVEKVRNKLEHVPWSWREENRRRFEAKYKGPIPQVVPELKTVRWFGKELLPEAQRGKVILLDFWGTRCGPCLKGMPKVQQLYHTCEEKGLVVIALTFPGDEDERIKAIIQDHGYTFYVAKAQIDTIAEYAIAGIPTYFLIDKKGCLVWGPEHEVPSEERIENLLNEN